MAPKIDPKVITSQLSERYMRLPLAQKIALPALLAFAVWAVVYASRVATQPDFTVLYSDLSTTDAGAVVNRLKEMKIAYRLDGNTISVSPPSQVHELRLSLASEGMPKTGSVGFELFDGTNFATTTLGEVVKKQRALQGELERTIMSLDAVVSARVHISQPEKTIFAKQAQDPGASVLLKLKPGSQLDKKQIKGIANFVASGVEGLKPENVTIIDEFGNLLTQTEADSQELGADATQLQYAREVEKGYAQRVESMLAKVLGPGKVVARVTAELDFSSSEREEESYDPGGKVIRSERSVEEGVAEAERGGVPGVVSNLSNDPKAMAALDGGTDKSSRKENVKNFEISRAVTRSSQGRGKLLRLSTAVLVDGRISEVPVVDGEGKPTGDVTRSYEALPPEMLAQVEAIVKSAVGYDVSRGDVVTVENVPFFAPDESLQQELAKAHKTDQYLKYGGMMVPIVALVLFMLFVLRPLVKFLTTTTHQEYDLSKLLPGEMLNADQPAKALPEASEAKGQAALEAGQAVAELGHEAETAETGAPAKKGGITGIEPSID
ncbi:MAG: flagellar basal-body MS-ring/collar protein FliF, partial [Pseudomonadota bacterium]